MRKLAFLVLGVVAAAGGCSTQEDSEPADPIPTDGVTQQQLTAYDALNAATQKTWKWVQHEDLKTPSHLSAKRIGAATLRPGDDIKARTIEVLTTNKALFKMRDPGLELAAARTESDHYGMSHVRFQQVAHGVPVVGAELSAHYDAAGHLASIDANYISELADVDVNPRVAEADALAAAKADILAHASIDEGKLSATPGKLVIYAKPAKESQAAITKLAYEVRIFALTGKDPAIWVYTIDAQTGDVLHRRNNLQTIDGSGVGVLGDTKKIEVASSGGGFAMNVTDADTGVPLQTFTAKQQDLTEEQMPGTLVTSTSSTSWDTGAAGRGAAVDAHFNASVVAKYYKTVHNRNAIDGVGGTLQSTVHYGDAYDNAAWVSTGMIYGDGGELFKALSASVDVVGHEFTHGVTEKTSNLTYEDQPGALNEAVSDIFGAFIEHSVAPDAVKNWAMGETITLSGIPLRDMSKPGSVEDPQPAHMNEFVQTQQDAGGVHINSGIINNAAFLMTVGGTNPVSKVEVKYGIGWEKSEKLWYQANTKYFMSTTNFAQAAASLQSAGKDVGLTTNELAIVDCAFKATGVVQGTCATLVNPQSTTGSADPGTGDVSETGSTTDDDDDDDDSTSKKKKPKKHTVTTQEPGCNATGSVDFGTLLPLFAAVAAIGAGRRRRRR
jgi:uncharacterized protein (TIGR03382 family)